ncbi:MAG: RES family NAD+ phosphorylase [Vulcanimicrobiaceae bacterium]
MIVARITRGGSYYRVCDPSWANPAITLYAKRFGGRWNPPGEFGALYLSATLTVAAANARRSISTEFGNAVSFSDIRPERRPDLQVFTVTNHAFVDAITDAGIAMLALPAAFPIGCDHAVCQTLGRDLYAADEAGIAARSAVEVGEELAIFDSHTALARRKRNGRLPFAQWYPGLA